MNYYEARQRQEDKKWDWTGMNDGKIFVAPPCCMPYGPCGHETKEEAEHHYWQYTFSKSEPFQVKDEKHRCEYPGCKKFTSWQLHAPRTLYLNHWLCDKHRSVETLKKMHPFEPGIQVISSY